MDFFSQSGHWYIRNASGKIEAAHDLDLRGARKVNARPSITTVLKERANPALDKWKQGILFQTMLDNPRYNNEELENYEGRIARLCSKPASDAADFGKELHGELDRYPKPCTNEKFKPYMDLFGPSYESVVKNRVGSEVMLCDDDIGIAGTTDLIAETHEWGLAIIDYKTSRFKGKPPSFWTSYRLQLAFYRSEEHTSELQSH